MSNVEQPRPHIFESGRQIFSFAHSLRGFFRERLTLQEAKQQIAKALEGREERFLELARREIYARPSSPYLKLLRVAGCEFADLQSHIHRDGLEKTLADLAKQGVYLTSDEFKGKKDVVRGRDSFKVSPDDFRRRCSPAGILTQSSGTSNPPLRSLRPLDWHAIGTLGLAVFFSAHNLFSYCHANYDAILPGSAVNSLLHYAKLGIRTDRWFARKIFVESRFEASYHYLVTYLIVMMGKWYGPGFPRPEFLDGRDLDPILRWIAGKGREGKLCCLNSNSSNAVRIAQAAWSKGIYLEGTKFRVHGEPVTDAKREVIERVGGSTLCRYNGGMSLGGGYGCANPRYTDEVHASEYNLALIPRPEPINQNGPPIHPLLFTTLYPSAPRLFLNVENGDYATLDKRDCGCDLEKAGLKLHLHHIRSYEKFTSEGMNYFYGDLYELFEKKLPSEFGGGPGDYQLVEEEDENGQTRITLRVHPEAGEIDQEKLRSRLREAMGRGSWGNEFQARVWDGAGTLRIKREAPFASARGKILPLQIKKSQ